jgi:hypothetical protein
MFVDKNNADIFYFKMNKLTNTQVNCVRLACFTKFSFLKFSLFIHLFIHSFNYFFFSDVI